MRVRATKDGRLCDSFYVYAYVYVYVHAFCPAFVWFFFVFAHRFNVALIYAIYSVLAFLAMRLFLFPLVFIFPVCVHLGGCLITLCFNWITTLACSHFIILVGIAKRLGNITVRFLDISFAPGP